MQLPSIPSFAVAGAALALAGAAAPAASAAPVVKVTVSTSYAVLGFPVTVTLSSTEAGTASLYQVRPDRALGPGRCSGYNARYVPGTTRAVTAGQKLTYTVQPASLFYGAGQVLQPVGWDDPSYPGYQDQCWDRYTTFNQLRGEVSTGAPAYGYGSDSKALTRLL